ncbi:hypothetical protein Cgig2_030167 [Carnegiea gigantea]|uniref:Pectinesterase inhibitor domain-containing protein n=1 Tax=Carnegiea gigantea TaxID=171969 RepID=A0A9Q1KAD2_9CARY|nr:hypothetical protein Cgig2_030167 [Carnegiea gigantea]
MKTTISPVFLVAFMAITTSTLLLTPMVAAKASPETQAVIDKVCRQMEDYQFCNQTFNNDLPQPDTDKVGLTKIAIVESQHNATNTLQFIRDLIPKEKDPGQLNHLTVCENAYGIVKQSFDQAYDAFNKGDYRGMQGYERITPRALASCVTIFQVPPKTNENPLNERNREMRILLTMAIVTATTSTLLLLSPMVASELSPATQAMIDLICRQMEDYQFCNQTFNHDLIEPFTDKVGFTRVAILEAQYNATNTLKFIRDELIPKEKDPGQLHNYQVCESAYDTLKESFDQAYDAFNRGDYQGMQNYERGTPKAIASCVTTFKVPPGALDERNREMRILLTMAVVTSSLLDK